MQFQVLQESLKRGLNIVSRATNEKSTLPVLANVLLTVNDSGLDLAATNIEMGIRTHIGAKVEQHGSITLPAKLLSDVVANLPNAPISFKIDMESMSATLTSGRFKTVIKGIDADEFPIIPQAPETAALTLQGKALREAINSVAYAADDSGDKPALKGVLFEIKEGCIHFVACDGFRLARHTIEIENSTPCRVTVPLGAVLEVARVLGDSETVKITTDDTRATFSADETLVITQLLYNEYPNYEAILRAIPTAKTRIIVDKPSVLQAVKLTKSFIDEKSSAVQVNVNSEIITFNAVGPEKGSSNSELPAMIEGETNNTKLNALYLIEAFNLCNSQQIALAMVDAQKPTIITPVGNENALHLIMPVNR